MKKFVHVTDLHYGFARKSGHKVPLHDPKAMQVALDFINDYQPDVIILGGDMLDCGAVSHHNVGKPGRTEGFRIINDAKGLADEFLSKLPKKAKKVYITGNHEVWLQDLEESVPGLEGLLKLETLLPLDGYEVIEQGREFNLGKLTFIHGDQISSTEMCAKNAVISYERSVRFGHYHSWSVYTKTSPIAQKLGKTGVCVPGLCTKDVPYGKGKPNKWMQGLCHGVIFGDGSYADHVSLITNGRMWANGKLYTA